MEIDIDMSQFHDIFFEEAIEGIEVMEKELLNLQPDECDNDTINTIFRAAHSIKGSASTFGFEAIGKFTHSIETVLDKIRNDELKITQELTSALLSAVDCLNNMLANEKASEAHDNSKIKFLATQLDDFSLQATNNNALPDAQCHIEENTDKEYSQKTEKMWKISFFPDKKLFYTGNDPLRLIRELQTLGSLSVETITDDLPDFDDFDVHDCYLGWLIQLQSNVNQEQIEEVFSWVVGDCVLKIENESEISIERRDTSIQTGRRKTDSEQRSIRVSTDKLDGLLNLVGELVITQSILNSICNEQKTEASEKLLQCLDQLERNTRDLQEQTMSIRMLPVDNAFQRIPRIVHDLSIALGKNVTLEFSGEATELDKTVLEKIGDPLIHLVRNAIDHGIESPEIRLAKGKPEQGVISIKAIHEGGYIVLQISDDGKGIDPEKVLDIAIDKKIINKDDELSDSQIMNLLFQPGFSTAKVISDISGRGVGMDVVKQNISDLGGSVDIWSEKDVGSTFTIKLPLTLAILDGQIVKVGNQTFIIPLHSISETLVFDDASTNTVAGKAELYQYRDEYIPIIRLYNLFNIKPNPISESGPNIEKVENKSNLLVVFDAGEKHAGILVDDVIGQQQVVIKSLEKNFNHVQGLTGATILGDGSVALILDMPTLSAQHNESSALSNTL